MQRSLQPELLDSLAPDHPAALHNRRDLRIINALTGNHRWLARTLPLLLRRGERSLELGAGTGELGSRLIAARVALDGLDLWPRPAAWPAARAWHLANLLTFDGYSPYAAIVGNLIFHQFAEADLAALGAKLRPKARVIIACEPARVRRGQILFRLAAPLIRANYVSRHDAHVSIAAGFRAEELPRALGLVSPDWEVRCTTTFLGINRMVAVRRT